MMRIKSDSSRLPQTMNDNEWEVRPSGMLVQKRNPNSDNRPPPPTIRVRVKYRSIYHDINISSQATFGELKKMLTGPTGLHHEDQKLLYKDKERENKAFLDISGVKDKSKIVLLEDPISQEKRYLEMRKNAKVNKAAETISGITLEVNRLAAQVSALETVISKGGKVVEKDVTNLTELLMNQLLQLDDIIAEGDMKLLSKNQARRIQKCVETLDVLKIKNSKQTSNTNRIPSNPAHRHQRYPSEHVSSPVQGRHSNGHSPEQTQEQYLSRNSTSGPVVVTTQWETFDSTPAMMLDYFSSPTTTSSTHVTHSWDLL